jgi:hypothetical protein
MACCTTAGSCQLQIFYKVISSIIRLTLSPLYTSDMKNLLFSYGTLQLESVQIASFGRKLNGFPAKIFGYKLKEVEITNPEVLLKSQQKFHPIAVQSKSSTDFVEGIAFELTEQELLQADEYEVDDYKRIEAELDSEQMAYIYVSVK